MTQDSNRDTDWGRAYGMKPATYRKDLVEVGPGTPMGELMRRYWQPCFTSEMLLSDRPRRVRLLGEDLIIFRDKQGKPGLVQEACCHRGCSLFFGRIEGDGLRCCYHGWKFDYEGRCLDQAAEIDGGRANRDKIRQPWYPVQERYGIVYAYMGPPEKQPLLPRWKQLEDLAPDEKIFIRIKPNGGPLSVEFGSYEMNPVPYNWLQIFENTMDATHVPWLHYYHSGDQFTSFELLNQTRMDESSELPGYAEIKDLAGRVIPKHSARGVQSGLPVPSADGGHVVIANEAMIPNVAVLGGIVDLYYLVPTDDTHHVAILMTRGKKEDVDKMDRVEVLPNGRLWWNLTPEEHQHYPSDYEAQGSIGLVPSHSREHLVQGDVAVAMLRKRLEQAVNDVAEGRDPPNVNFDENAPPIDTSDVGMTPFDIFTKDSSAPSI